jgi:23S rRNA (guanosine2251-2'-O)-methyltransferase
MQHVLIVENIRSSYNVGNMIRTADALWRQVRCSGFSPTPESDPAVKKTALGAEVSVWLQSFWNATHALDKAQELGYLLVALEITPTSMLLDDFCVQYMRGEQPIALICGNENTGVLPETLDRCACHVHISMLGIKESLNVGQAAAIAMYQINKYPNKHQIPRHSDAEWNESEVPKGIANPGNVFFK